jgi:predicted nucleotidyltransferase component of viral defense system
MLSDDDLRRFTGDFGVSDDQVRRDHLISHVLVALAAIDAPVTFFGGTALSRTHLTDPLTGARLSEDVDLYGPDRRRTAALLDRELPLYLRREFPGCFWDPALSSVRSIDAGQLVTADGLRVRVQVLDMSADHADLRRWPTEVAPISLRYADLPEHVDLQVPTRPAIVAMKTVAWLDRHTARDLYDLAGLAALGAIDAEANTLLKKVVGWTVPRSAFGSMPPIDWDSQLAHQTSRVPDADACLRAVRAAYRAAATTPAAAT